MLFKDWSGGGSKVLVNVFFVQKQLIHLYWSEVFRIKVFFAAGRQPWWVWSLFKSSLFVALNKKKKQSVLAWLEALSSIKLKTVLICIFLFLVQPTAAAFVSYFTSGLDVKAAALVWIHVCVGECLHQRRLLMKYDLWKKKKEKFPVRVLLLELQSIIYLQVSDSTQQVLVC